MVVSVLRKTAHFATEQIRPATIYNPLFRSTIKDFVANIFDQRRLALGESSSEPNLATGDREEWLSGFPPGFTVDELRWHRKKKQPSDVGQKDNLKLEEGSMKLYKSEYTRRYKKFDYLPASSEDLTTGTIDMHVRRRRRRRRPTDSDDFVGSKESLMDYTSEQHDKFIPLGGAPPAQIIRRSSSLQREGEYTSTSSEMQSKYKRYEDPQRAKLYRRPTSLRMEGDMDTTTETAEQFIEILINQRPEFAKMTSNLQMEGEMQKTTEKTDMYKKYDVQKQQLTKQPTNLQLHGKMSIQTEKQEKYIPFNLQERPKLIKRGTNLRLEGDMETGTENREKFLPFDTQRQRIPLMKRSTNLHLDGEMDIRTESNMQYVPMESKRPPLAKRDTNLQLEGELTLAPEYREAYIEYPSGVKFKKIGKPVNNIGSEYCSDRDESPEKIFKSEHRYEMMPLYKENYKPHTVKKSVTTKPTGNLKSEGILNLTTESHEIGRDLLRQGTKQIDYTSEIKNASLPRDVSPKDARPGAGISSQEIRQKRTREQARPAGNLRNEGRLESNPEYRSSYVDFPRERPVVKKPTSSLRRAEGNMAHQTEKEAKYVQHCYAPRREASKREDELKLEGHFECQPEYRKAYIAYLTRENIHRIPRLADNLEQLEEPEEVECPIAVEEKIPPKVKASSFCRRPKIRDRTVPRTPRQQKVLVPDLSGNTLRRTSSIFGPRQLRKTVISRPESPVSSLGGYRYVMPQDATEMYDYREQSPSRKSSSREGSPCEKPPCPTKTYPREKIVPSSPCGTHRSPSGRPCLRKHSPCARMAAPRQTSPCSRNVSPCRRSCEKGTYGRQSSPCGRHLSPCDKTRPSSRQEPIPIRLYPPSPTIKKRSTSPKRLPSKTSSSEDEVYKTTLKHKETAKQAKITSPAVRRKKVNREEKLNESLASFVVLQENNEINNNKVKRSEEKEQRWMPAWYEQPKK